MEWLFGLERWGHSISEVVTALFFLDNSKKGTPKCEYWANIGSMWKLQVPTGDAGTPDPDGNHSMKGNIPTWWHSFHQSRHYTALKVFYGFHSHPSTSVSLLTLSLVTAPHLYQRISLDCGRLVSCRLVKWVTFLTFLDTM